MRPEKQVPNVESQASHDCRRGEDWKYCAVTLLNIISSQILTAQSPQHSGSQLFGEKLH